MDWEKIELDLVEQVTDKRLMVRNNCAFCHRERSADDDNHAPECPYWVFFGTGQES